MVPKASLPFPFAFVYRRFLLGGSTKTHAPSDRWNLNYVTVHSWHAPLSSLYIWWRTRAWNDLGDRCTANKPRSRLVSLARHVFTWSDWKPCNTRTRRTRFTSRNLSSRRMKERTSHDKRTIRVDVCPQNSRRFCDRNFNVVNRPLGIELIFSSVIDRKNLSKSVGYEQQNLWFEEIDFWIKVDLFNCFRSMEIQ